MGWQKREVPWTHWVHNDLMLQDWEDIGNQALVDWASFRDDPSSGWVHYDNDVERHKWACTDLTRIEPIAKLFWAINTYLFVSRLCDLTRIDGLMPDPTMHGAGLHVVEPGGWLSPHLDYAKHPKLPIMERRVNLIIFLNEGVGGAFELWDDEAREVKARVSPSPGRAVVWCPGDVEYHGTQRVEGTIPRLALACYYLAPARSTAVRKRALFVPNRG